MICLKLCVSIAWYGALLCSMMRYCVRLCALVFYCVYCVDCVYCVLLCFIVFCFPSPVGRCGLACLPFPVSGLADRDLVTARASVIGII